MTKTNKMQLPDGTIVIKCPECNKLRNAQSFRENGEWIPKCSYCRNRQSFEEGLDEEVMDCGGCGGTGRYVNPVNHWTGVCYRCKGKGKQSRRDIMRNQTYDEHAAARAAHGDLSSFPEYDPDEAERQSTVYAEEPEDWQSEFEGDFVT
jgi:hypothetical protein